MGHSLYAVCSARVKQYLKQAFSFLPHSSHPQPNKKPFQPDLPPGDLTLKERESVNSSVLSSSATPWTIANQAFLSMEFSGQEYWSGLPFPFLGPCIT